MRKLLPHKRTDSAMMLRLYQPEAQQWLCRESTEGVLILGGGPGRWTQNCRTSKWTGMCLRENAKKLIGRSRFGRSDRWLVMVRTSTVANANGRGRFAARVFLFFGAAATVASLLGLA